MESPPTASRPAGLDPGDGSFRVLIAEGRPLLAGAVERILRHEELVDVCGVAHTSTDAMEVVRRETVHVALIGERLRDMKGPAGAAKIRASRPEVAFLFYDLDPADDAVLDAVDAGAAGYLTWSATADDLVHAVRRVAQGEVLIPAPVLAKALARHRESDGAGASRFGQHSRFTPRELEILTLLAQGHRASAIAKDLGITRHTVEWHIRHLLHKFHVNSRLQAVMAAARLGLIDLS